MATSQKDLKLLPYSFRKLAWILLGIVFISVIIMLIGVFPLDIKLGKTILLNITLVAFSLFAMTRNKVEDERTVRIRLRAFAAAFMFGVTLVILEPYLNLAFWGDFIQADSAGGMLLQMFFFYFAMYFIVSTQE